MSKEGSSIKKVELTRKDLYDFVWGEPLSHFIEVYGGTYAEVKMLLEKYNIPAPPNGYWSKLKAGHQIPKTELPDYKGSEIIHYEPRIKIERVKLRVESTVEKPSENQANNLDKLVADAQKIYLKESKSRENNQLIYIGYESLKINASPMVIDRVLSFFNSIILNVRKIGGDIKLETNSTFAIVDGEKFSISIREKQSRIKKMEQKYSWNEYDYIASGILYFKVGENSWDSKEWNDTAYTRLEDKVENIIDYLKLAAIDVKEQRRKQEVRRIEEAKERQVKADIEKRRALELAKFVKLKDDSELWEKSMIMRKYLEETERMAREQNRYDEELESYLAWARSKVDWYDPFINKDDELLNDVDKKTLALVKKGYW